MELKTIADSGSTVNNNLQFVSNVLCFICNFTYSTEEQPIKRNVRHIQQGPFTLLANVREGSQVLQHSRVFSFFCGFVFPNHVMLIQFVLRTFAGKYIDFFTNILWSDNELLVRNAR